MLFEKSAFYPDISPWQTVCVPMESNTQISAPSPASQKKVNLSIASVIHIFDIIQYEPSNLPTVLSIDEFKGRTGTEKYQCIITDPLNRRIIDILPSREKHWLITYFKGFDRSITTYFVSDMWSPYADISYTFFKNATFVVDKYHYIRQVIWAFEGIRKRFRISFHQAGESTLNDLELY